MAEDTAGLSEEVAGLFLMAGEPVDEDAAADAGQPVDEDAGKLEVEDAGETAEKRARGVVFRPLASQARVFSERKNSATSRQVDKRCFSASVPAFLAPLHEEGLEEAAACTPGCL